MKKLIIYFILIVFIAFFSIRAYKLGVFDFNPVKNNKEEIIINGQMIKEKIENANELITLKYYYTYAEPFKSFKEFNDWKIPFTEKSFVLKFDGILFVGIDIDKIKIDINDKNIKIIVPKAKIIANDLDENSIEVISEGQTFLNPINATDFKEFLKSQEENIQNIASKKGIIEQANKSSELTIKNILNIDKNISENYIIEIEFE